MRTIRLFARNGQSAQDQDPIIDFRNRHWFEDYLLYRKREPISLEMVDPALLGLQAEDLRHFESLDYPLYHMLLHSGMIYGFPFVYPFRPAPPQALNRHWITRLTLVDIGLFSLLRHLERRSAPHVRPEEAIDQAARLMRMYYRGLRQQGEGVEEATFERLMTHHISVRRHLFDWRRGGINCHLFWDWYFFIQFLEARENGQATDKAWFEDLIRRRRAMKMLTMQLIAAAAHSDHKIQPGERVLQHHFERSSHFFTPQEQARIRAFFRDGISLDAIHLPEADWMVHRYWLDISLMTLFADKEIAEVEEVYLQRLMEKLQLQDLDLMQSKLALGGFLLRYGKRLPFFNSRKAGLALIGKALTENVENLRKAAHGEFLETVEMADTFGRLLQYKMGVGKNKKLPTEEEIARALDQLKDLPKFLPFFSLIIIPVPGITECYIMLAYSIERLSGNHIRLLPSQFSRMVKGK